MGADSQEVTKISLLVRLAGNLTSREVKASLTVATSAGILSGILFLLDKNFDFLDTIMPDKEVFNVFITFVSVVTAFRTSHALVRYTDAAAYIHQLSACWFDTASTLIAFCRNTEAARDEIDQFQHTLVRLVSLMSALCLDELQGASRHDRGRHRFEVLTIDALDPETKDTIRMTKHKVECVFQMIQQLVVDAMPTGVLSIAPPILSRSFQEMGAGLLTYHEAMKLACVPVPSAYVLITYVLLASETLFVPFVMATYTKGVWSSFFYTTVGTFLLWFMNQVADTLDNPFQKAARTLDAAKVQYDMNRHLEQLMELAHMNKPMCLGISLQCSLHGDSGGQEHKNHNRVTLHSSLGGASLGSRSVDSQPSDASQLEKTDSAKSDTGESSITTSLAMRMAANLWGKPKPPPDKPRHSLEMMFPSAAEIADKPRRSIESATTASAYSHEGSPLDALQEFQRHLQREAEDFADTDLGSQPEVRVPLESRATPSRSSTSRLQGGTAREGREHLGALTEVQAEPPVGTSRGYDEEAIPRERGKVRAAEGCAAAIPDHFFDTKPMPTSKGGAAAAKKDDVDATAPARVGNAFDSLGKNTLDAKDHSIDPEEGGLRSRV